MTTTFADIEAVLVAFLKTNVPLVTNRVATELPEGLFNGSAPVNPDSDPTVAFIMVQRVGGAPNEELPIDGALLQVSVYAPPKKKVTAVDAQREVMKALYDNANQVQAVPGTHPDVHIQGFAMLSARRVPEPETGWVRYDVDVFAYTKET